MDLRDCGRADRLVLRHRPHDHRQSGAACHRSNYLRHHRNRRDRPNLRFPLQMGKPAAVSLEPCVSELVIDNVSRIFPGARRRAPTRALEPTNLTIPDNDFVTIVGPSGCGKSTLLWLIVADNIAFGLREKGTPAHRRTAIVREWLVRIDLFSFEHHYPKQLSGGMQQRTAIARALANDP